MATHAHTCTNLHEHRTGLLLPRSSHPALNDHLTCNRHQISMFADDSLSCISLDVASVRAAASETKERYHQQALSILLPAMEGC